MWILRCKQTWVSGKMSTVFTRSHMWAADLYHTSFNYSSDALNLNLCSWKNIRETGDRAHPIAMNTVAFCQKCWNDQHSEYYMRYDFYLHCEWLTPFIWWRKIGKTTSVVSASKTWTSYKSNSPIIVQVSSFPDHKYCH